MAGLTTPRDTKPRGTAPLPTEMEPGVKGGSKIIQGGIVVIDSSGYATPATAAPGLICLGIANSRFVGGQTATSGAIPTAGVDDNTTGANAAIRTRVLTGTFKVDNGATTDAVLITDVGNDCFLLDDHTVARTDKGNTLSRAGKIVDVDSDGVWVCFGHALAGAATFPQLGAMLNDLGYHAPVRFVVPTNFVGTNVAGVLTATSNGALAAQDGVTAVVGDRCLIAGQTTAADNGIYVVTSLGGASAKAVFTRASDAATGAAIVNGATVPVSEGTSYAGTTWLSRATGAGNLVGTNDPKFYPECYRKTITLAAGTYTIGAGGGAEPLFLFSTTSSVVSVTRNTANTSTATTGGYAAPVASRIAGIAGVAAVLIQAQVAAGTISNADVSTIDVLITN